MSLTQTEYPFRKAPENFSWQEWGGGCNVTWDVSWWGRLNRETDWIEPDGTKRWWILKTCWSKKSKGKHRTTNVKSLPFLCSPKKRENTKTDLLPFSKELQLKTWSSGNQTRGAKKKKTLTHFSNMSLVFFVLKSKKEYSGTWTRQGHSSLIILQRDSMNYLWQFSLWGFIFFLDFFLAIAPSEIIYENIHFQQSTLKDRWWYLDFSYVEVISKHDQQI